MNDVLGAILNANGNLIAAARPTCRFCPKSAVYDFGIEFAVNLPICAHCITAMLKRIRIPSSSFAATPGGNVTAAVSPPASQAAVAVTIISHLPQGGSPATVGVSAVSSAVAPIPDLDFEAEVSAFEVEMGYRAAPDSAKNAATSASFAASDSAENSKSISGV